MVNAIDCLFPWCCDASFKCWIRQGMKADGLLIKLSHQFEADSDSLRGCGSTGMTNIMHNWLRKVGCVV